MAVVSISRIQVRRGRKNEGSGLPQLASGEIGWALDTQELFIGNGSVAEGAPFVGNTKLLTEKDNILAFATSYEYKADTSFLLTGPSPIAPIQRSLQQRLDDFVTLKSFGADGDGTDQTAQLQRAIDQIFLNPAALLDLSSRTVIRIPAGDYLISDTIYLPPFAIIEGDGAANTVIRKTTAGPAFQTVSRLSTPGNPVPTANVTIDNQAKDIRLGGFSLEIVDQIGIDLQSCIDSTFHDISITGTWNHGETYDNTNCGIRMTSTATAETKHNRIQNMSFNKLSFGVYSDYNSNDNTIADSTFYENRISIALGWGFNVNVGPLAIFGSPGADIGPSNNSITNNSFDYISKEALYIERGNNNISSNNTYYRVGFPLIADSVEVNKLLPQTAVIKYGTATIGNTSTHDFFERSSEYSLSAEYYNTPYFPEIDGRSSTDYPISYTNLAPGLSPTVFLQLPADREKRVEIKYVYKNTAESIVQVGTLLILVDPFNPGQPTTLTHEYDYSGSPSKSKSLSFTTELFNVDNTNLTYETLGVKLSNSLPSSGEFIYTVNTIG
jgi:hypothetical protein